MAGYKQSKKRLDSNKECALICRSDNMPSDVAVEHFAIKLMELKKRLEVACSE